MRKVNLDMPIGSQIRVELAGADHIEDDGNRRAALALIIMKEFGQFPKRCRKNLDVKIILAGK